MSADELGALCKDCQLSCGTAGIEQCPSLAFAETLLSFFPRCFLLRILSNDATAKKRQGAMKVVPSAIERPFPRGQAPAKGHA